MQGVAVSSSKGDASQTSNGTGKPMMCRAKQKPDARGRSTGAVGSFSRVDLDMQKSAAFQSLTASALRILIWALFRNYNANKADGSRPKFTMTNADAKRHCCMNPSTFTRAKEELSEKGFLEWAQRGGLKGVNGVCSTYMLSGEWKKWAPPPKKSSTNLLKAREALKLQKQQQETKTMHGKSLRVSSQLDRFLLPTSQAH